MNTCRGTWLLLGAGISASAPSNLPLWREVAQDTMSFLYRTLEYKIRETGGDGYLHAKEALSLIERQSYPESVLESVSCAYGRAGVVSRLCSLLAPGDSEPNVCHQAVAQLCKQGVVRGIVTTNLDTLLELALDQEGIPYRVIAHANMDQGGAIPLVKVHGTVKDPSSLVFTHSEYYVGISPDIREMLLSNMAGSVLLIAGYSGNDIDVFPFIRAMIKNGLFSKVQVVDVAPLDQNERFAAMGNDIDYHNGPAEEFLCASAKMPLSQKAPSRRRRLSAIVPDDDKFPAALFFGDSLLQLSADDRLAFRLFFLTQDIVEEETGDLRQLCISQFAKSCALLSMGDNRWGESEYSAGRKMLHRLIENSGLPKLKDMLSEFGASLLALELEPDVRRTASSSSFMSGRHMARGPDRFDDSTRGIELLRSVLSWELRARIRVCFSALAFAAGARCQGRQRHDMLAVPESLMREFRRWGEYFPDSRSADQLPLLPLFYSKFFRVFQSLILSNRNVLGDIEECLQLSRQRGFYVGTSHCYFLKRMYGIDMSEAEHSDYASIQRYCSVNEQRMIAPFYRPGEEPFDLTLGVYHPPLEER